MSVTCLTESSLWAKHAHVDSQMTIKIMEDIASFQEAPWPITVVLGHDALIQPLNHHFLGKNKPTNVLSFPDTKDIILSYETIEREAVEQGKPFLHHMTHMLVHGFLHLLGYTHDSDDEAEKMEAYEAVILASLHVPNPYSYAA